MSEASLDVAAIRAALAKATPGPWRLESPRISLVDHDAELVVLLRNSAEALLRMLDDGYCAGYDHGVEDQMDRQARMEPGRWWRAVDPDGDVWCESSSEDEVREMARPGDRIERLFTSTAGEWREVSP